MFRITIGKYTLSCSQGTAPELYEKYCARAALVDEIDLDRVDGDYCFLAVQESQAWPFLVVAQRYRPAGYSFYPGVVIVPETDLLLLGAGERLLAYSLGPGRPERLWEDKADMGFLAWERYQGFLIMSAELELAVWDVHGDKKWSTFVEPPWHYTVEGDMLHLGVMGRASSFHLSEGPPG